MLELVALLPAQRVSRLEMISKRNAGSTLLKAGSATTKGMARPAPEARVMTAAPQGRFE